jgi:hypothetical protein
VLAASGAPAGEFAGDLYFDTTSGSLRVFDGTSWSTVSGASSSDFTDADLSRLTESLDGGEIAFRNGILYIQEQTIAYSGDSPNSVSALALDGGSNSTNFPNLDGGLSTQQFAFTKTLSGGDSDSEHTVVVDAGGV